MSYRNNVLERFAAKVECGPEIDSCWEWTGTHSGMGYGRFLLDGKKYLAHRMSYILYRGKIPEGLVLDHLCRNPSCVNPDHLEAVTNKENINRGINYSSSLTHCIRGHEFNEENTYTIDNKRVCKPCRRIRDNRRRIKYNG